MPSVSTELVGLVSFLLPGFVAAWVFYGLTAHRKSSEFERVIQALIFTALVQAAKAVVQWLLFRVGEVYTIGEWTENVEAVWSLALALVIGVASAWLANHDWLHKQFRWMGITQRTSYPQEWFSAFRRFGRNYVVLYLHDQRRLYAWPEEWPDHPDTGYFCLVGASWLRHDNTMVPIHVTKRFLVAAQDVKMVEFLKTDAELTVSAEQVLLDNAKLIEPRTPSDD